MKRCIVEAVAPTGHAILNANDPLVVPMAAHCPGEVIFFALDPNNPVIVRHRGVGGRAAFIRDPPDRSGRRRTRRDPALARRAADYAQRPDLLPGRKRLGASIAAAWSIGISLDVIRARAESIAADLDKVPGRFNVMEIEGATVVVDYGHNSHSLSAVIEALRTFPHERRTCVYSTAGDRRDCDIVRQGELLGAAFDRVILYEDHYRRGRVQGEIVELFRKGLESASRAKEIIEVTGATNAAETALKSTQPGELVLLQADAIDETVQWLRGYLDAIAAKTSGDLIEQVLSEAEAAAAGKPRDAAEVQTPVLAEAHTVAKV